MSKSPVAHARSGLTSRQLWLICAAAFLLALLAVLGPPGSGQIGLALAVSFTVGGVVAAGFALRAPKPERKIRPERASLAATGVTAAGTNGFAVASMVLGIIGVWVLAIIFGLVALRQVDRSGQAGRGMAIAGVALGIAWAVAFIGLVVLVVVAAS